MSNNVIQIPTSPLITKVVWQRKLKAFVTMTLTVFILGILAFPLTTDSPKSESAPADDPLAVVGQQVNAKLAHLTHLNERQNSQLQITERSLKDLGSKIRTASRPDQSFDTQANALFETAVKNQQVGNATELAELNQRLDTLIQQREQSQLSNGLENPTTRFLHSEVEKIRMEIAFLDDPWNRGEMNIQSVQPTHQQMGFFDEAGVAEILEPAFDSFTQVRNDMAAEQQTIAEVISMFSNLEPVETSTVSTPTKPNVMPRLIWIGLFAVVLGASVVWYLNPLYSDTGFKDDSEVEEFLGVPVIATLTTDETTAGKSSKPPLANFVVDMSEYILLALATILVISMVFSPVLRETFFNNPLTGISEVIWSIVG